MQETGKGENELMANKKKKEEKKDNKHTIKVCANIRNQYDFYMTGGQESITDAAIPKSNKIQKQLKKRIKHNFQIWRMGRYSEAAISYT